MLPQKREVILAVLALVAATYEDEASTVSSLASELAGSVAAWSSPDGLLPALSIQNSFADFQSAVETLSSSASDLPDADVDVDQTNSLVATIVDLLDQLSSKAQDFNAVQALSIVQGDLTSLEPLALTIALSIVAAVSDDCSKYLQITDALEDYSAAFSTANSAYNLSQITGFPDITSCVVSSSVASSTVASSSASSSSSTAAPASTSSSSEVPASTSSSSEVPASTSSSSEVPASTSSSSESPASSSSSPEAPASTSTLSSSEAPSSTSSSTSEVPATSSSSETPASTSSSSSVSSSLSSSSSETPVSSAAAVVSSSVPATIPSTSGSSTTVESSSVTPVNPASPSSTVSQLASSTVSSEVSSTILTPPLALLSTLVASNVSLSTTSIPSVVAFNTTSPGTSTGALATGLPPSVPSSGGAFANSSSGNVTGPTTPVFYGNTTTTLTDESITTIHISGSASGTAPSFAAGSSTGQPTVALANAGIRKAACVAAVVMGLGAFVL